MFLVPFQLGRVTLEKTRELFIFTVESAHGDPLFAVRHDAEPNRLNNGHETLEEAAQMAYVRVQSLQSDGFAVAMTVEPPHDFECVQGQEPRRLKPLTDAEKDQFYHAFLEVGGWSKR